MNVYGEDVDEETICSCNTPRHIHSLDSQAVVATAAAVTANTCSCLTTPVVVRAEISKLLCKGLFSCLCLCAVKLWSTEPAFNKLTSTSSETSSAATYGGALVGISKEEPDKRRRRRRRRLAPAEKGVSAIPGAAASVVTAFAGGAGGIGEREISSNAVSPQSLFRALFRDSARLPDDDQVTCFSTELTSSEDCSAATPTATVLISSKAAATAAVATTGPTAIDLTDTTARVEGSDRHHTVAPFIPRGQEDSSNTATVSLSVSESGIVGIEILDSSVMPPTMPSNRGSPVGSSPVTESGDMDDTTPGNRRSAVARMLACQDMVVKVVHKSSISSTSSSCTLGSSSSQQRQQPEGNEREFEASDEQGEADALLRRVRQLCQLQLCQLCQLCCAGSGCAGRHPPLQSLVPRQTEVSTQHDDSGQFACGRDAAHGHGGAAAEETDGERVRPNFRCYNRQVSDGAALREAGRSRRAAAAAAAGRGGCGFLPDCCRPARSWEWGPHRLCIYGQLRPSTGLRIASRRL
eukprot:GHVU01193983.1.p1 GENE.GHVU01193983.1~~GHVU01193983.1.p1  ORF type:complete len:522 (-),score=64.45 GHVU01193983.1:1243-2808(-)